MKTQDIIIRKSLEAWRKYKGALEEGYPEEIEETYQNYLDYEGVRVEIQTPVEALEDQVHENWMGFRNPNKAHLTSDAILEFKRILEYFAGDLLHSAGSLAWIRALRKHEGKEDVIIDEDIVYLAYLNILSGLITSEDEETLKRHNALYRSIIYGEMEVE
ncbi:hypothetical protein [Methanothermobacter marburgensis]|uniref:hypothetical protein n=1 Tax=Methanothermobacter marburgensis TaxID=145263 RepID=UPI0035B88729